jgi:hypothetical protein
MIQLKIYIAGPMRGYDNHNFDEFFKAEEHLRHKGYLDIVNPAQLDKDDGIDPNVDDVDIKSILRRDITHLMKCNSLFLLRGWEKSEGARAEHSVASAMGMFMWYQ